MLSMRRATRLPASTQRTHSPADWGICMTVCIAAACNTSRTIVTVSDRMAVWGQGETTADNVLLKLVRVHHPNWIAMIAGDDITIGVENVIRHAADTLLAYERPPSTLEVQAALIGAWRDEQNRVGQTMVLNPFRLTVEQFVRDGRQIFGGAKFSELATDLSIASKLKCQLLVCGFDENKMPALLVCDDDFGCRDYSRGGYVAIGSGQSQAFNSLSFHEYDTMCDLGQAIYRVCAAKFMAEKSVGVGRETVVMCLREDGKTKLMFKRAIEPIRKLWEEEGRPRLPSEEHINARIGSIESQLPWIDL